MNKFKTDAIEILQKKKTPLDESNIIWRYMNFSRLMDIIENKRLGFSRINIFKDAFEGKFKNKTFIGHIVAGGRNRNRMKLENEQHMQHLSEIEKKVKNEYYASCWSKSKNENYALWKIFTKPSEGVAIRTTIFKFLECFSPEINIIHEKISYDITHRNPFDIKNYIFSKHPFYEYEKEYRFAIDGSENGFFSDHEYLHINKLENLIEEIYFSPFMSEKRKNEKYNIINEICPNLKINFNSSIKIKRLRKTKI